MHLHKWQKLPLDQHPNLVAWMKRMEDLPCWKETDAAKLRYHSAEESSPKVQVMTCDACRSYLHLVDLSADRQAVADVDEIAALALDVWASEQGYTKIHPNLAGV